EVQAAHANQVSEDGQFICRTAADRSTDEWPKVPSQLCKGRLLAAWIAVEQVLVAPPGRGSEGSDRSAKLRARSRRSLDADPGQFQPVSRPCRHRRLALARPRAARTCAGAGAPPLPATGC